MDIVTTRLRLDALVPDDAAALFAYRADPAVSRFQGWKPASVADAARFIETQQAVVPGTHEISGPFCDRHRALTEWRRLTFRDHMAATTRYVIAEEGHV